MTEMFNPNFAALQDTTTQARTLATALRKQALQRQMPVGEMVSGHYVAPHWSAHLGNILDQLNAGWRERLATQAEQDMTSAQANAAEQWRAGLPQPQSATAFAPATPFGSRDVPRQDAVQASPAVPVSTATRLKHTLAGMQNPLTAKEAVLWNAALAEETKREDEQLARRENLIATLEARKEDALRRSEDARLTREQQAELRREALAAQQQIAAMHAATQQTIAGMNNATRRDIAAMHSGASTDKQQERIDKQLPQIAEKLKEINPLISSGQSLQDLFDRYGNKAIPGFGYAGKLPGVALSKEGNMNRAILKAFTNSIMRAHAGLSQTLAEQHNVNLETLADGNYSEAEIRKIWPTLREKANDALKGITAGYMPEAIDVYKKRGGLANPIGPKTAWKIEVAK